VFSLEEKKLLAVDAVVCNLGEKNESTYYMNYECICTKGDLYLEY
jgi:hypothetical protein